VWVLLSNSPTDSWHENSRRQSARGVAQRGFGLRDPEWISTARELVNFSQSTLFELQRSGFTKALLCYSPSDLLYSF
jgi:hypothetical protein